MEGVPAIHLNQQKARQESLILFMSKFLRLPALLIVVAISVAACDDGNLRGSVTKSIDGKTYLVVMDDNGGKCRPIMIDDKIWPYEIGMAGPINPGHHEINCGGWKNFTIPPGTTFHLDYQGP